MEGRVFFTAFIPSLVSWPSDWGGYICPRLPDCHHVRQSGKTTGCQLTSRKTSCCCLNTWIFGCYHFGSYSNQMHNCRRLQPLELSGALPSAALITKGKKPKPFIFSHPPSVHSTFVFRPSSLRPVKHLLLNGCGQGSQAMVWRSFYSDIRPPCRW